MPRAERNFSRLSTRQLRRGHRGGFTLIEAGFVTVVIGVCAVATLRLLAAGTMSNDASAEMTIAANLANNVHEMMAGLPLYDPQNPTAWISREASVSAYDNVTDFDGQTYTPPLDAGRQSLANYSNWSQAITVQSVSEDDVTTVKTPSASEKAARITVTISHNGKTVLQTSWVVADHVGG